MLNIVYIFVISVFITLAFFQYNFFIRKFHIDNALSNFRELQHEAIIYLSGGIKAKLSMTEVENYRYYLDEISLAINNLETTKQNIYAFNKNRISLKQEILNKALRRKSLNELLSQLRENRNNLYPECTVSTFNIQDELFTFKSFRSLQVIKYLAFFQILSVIAYLFHYYVTIFIDDKKIITKPNFYDTVIEKIESRPTEMDLLFLIYIFYVIFFIRTEAKYIKFINKIRNYIKDTTHQISYKLKHAISIHK